VTAVRTVTLSCEHHACESTLTIVVQGSSEDEPFQRAVRQQAHDAGWVFRDGLDLCPTHRPPLMPTRYVDCPRPGCGRSVAVNRDGTLRRHRRIVDGELGPSCRDLVTGDVHTRYPNLMEDRHA
jgi:hypothetical protein